MLERLRHPGLMPVQSLGARCVVTTACSMCVTLVGTGRALLPGAHGLPATPTRGAGAARLRHAGRLALWGRAGRRVVQGHHSMSFTIHKYTANIRYGISEGRSQVAESACVAAPILGFSGSPFVNTCNTWNKQHQELQVQRQHIRTKHVDHANGPASLAQQGQSH